jgi:ATP-dependent Clp protease ATP-binding subunit ClpA
VAHQPSEPVHSGSVNDAEPVPTPRYTALLAAAADLARSMSHQYVGAEHLFLAIIRDPQAVPTQVLAAAIPPAEVEASLRTMMGSANYTTPSRKKFAPPRTDEHGD